MTLQEAKTLKQGDFIHHIVKKNVDGTPMRARITSIKTWKTRPAEISVRYKHGLFDYGVLNQNEIYLLNIGRGD